MNQEGKDPLYFFWIFLTIGLVLFFIYFPFKNPEEIKKIDLRNIARLIDDFGKSLKQVNLSASEEIRNKQIEDYCRFYLAPQLLEKWKENPELALGKRTSSSWPEKIEIDSLTFFKDKALIEAHLIEMTSEGASERKALEIELTLKDSLARKWIISDIRIKEEETSLANPAAVFCQSQGYQYEIREDPEGNQYGVCVFDDGNECEEWAFYRNECGIEYLKENLEIENQECAKEGERVNRNPLLGPTDKKCCEGLIEERVSRSYSICRRIEDKIEESKPETPVCQDLCGDGICQEVVCLAVGCPCAETPESCPQDCH